MALSVPSLEMSKVWFASATTKPSHKERIAGFSTVWRVSSLMILKIVSRGVPAASAKVPPVKDSATGFRKVVEPLVSVVMTAPPMLDSVYT